MDESPDFSRLKLITMANGEPGHPALFTGQSGTFDGEVPEEPERRMLRGGRWYELDTDHLTGTALYNELPSTNATGGPA